MFLNTYLSVRLLKTWEHTLHGILTGFVVTFIKQLSTIADHHARNFLNNVLKKSLKLEIQTCYIYHCILRLHNYIIQVFM